MHFWAREILLRQGGRRVRRPPMKWSAVAKVWEALGHVNGLTERSKCGPTQYQIHNTCKSAVFPTIVRSIPLLSVSIDSEVGYALTCTDAMKCVWATYHHLTYTSLEIKFISKLWHLTVMEENIILYTGLGLLMFMSVRWDHVSELRPPTTGLFFI
jgi:hypothetical protein